MFQWRKLGLNWGLIAVLTLITLMKGGTDPGDSIIGIKKCDPSDWLLFFILQIVCFLFLGIGTKIVNEEYKQKTEAGYQFTDGDFEGTTFNLFIISAMSFLGAIIASFSGTSPGFIFVNGLFIIGTDP